MRVARQLGRIQAIALVLGFLAAPTVGAASPQGDVAQAKALYSDGLEALKAKDYVKAVSKFEEAYRLAPDKHLFNYNIGSAAELAGDCRKAQIAYQKFLDLVPKHDERKQVEKSLASLQKTCAFDDDTEQQNTAEGIEDREVAREEEDSERKLREALKQTKKAAAIYDAALAKHGAKAKRSFKRVAKTKHRTAAKIEKLMVAHGYEKREDDLGEVRTTDTIKGACRQAAGQEARSAELYAEVYELFDSPSMSRAMAKFERQAVRFETAFDSNCPR